MATVREIARQAGVSKTTVSLVLNNRDGVSERTRKRVYEAINRLRVLEEAKSITDVSMGINAMPSSKLDEDMHRTLLVLHPANIHSSPVFHEVIHGIQAAASLFHLQLNLALNDPVLLGKTMENLYFANRILQPSGVIVLGARMDEPVLDRVKELGVPIVLTGRNVQQRGISTIGRDEENLAFQATDYLIQLGHRNIVFLGGNTKYSYTFDRLNGFRKALQENGIEVDECRINLGFDVERAAKLLLSTPEITGAVFVNELFAVRVLPVVKEGGKQIPRDLSVVTFDDTEVSRSFDPPLTTVSFPFFQEGFWAVRVIMEQIRQPVLLNCHVTLNASLVIRESCAALAQAIA